LEYLHSVGVSHRDIKPENIFVNDLGHLKLGDLGSAGVSKLAREKLNIMSHKHKDGVKEDGKLNTFVGTKEYVSPEVLKGKGCSPAADMWSLGVIIFQLYTGYTPFYDPDGELPTFQNIMECKYTIPSSVPDKAKDLIERLLTASSDERLSASQARDHEFFAEYDFNEFTDVESPLLKLYDLIDKEKFDDESSCEYDSIVDGDGFDVDFAESPAVNKEILVNLQKDNNPNKAYRAYLKKSSSLGEKELFNLEAKQKELEENKPEEKFYFEKRPYAKSADTDDSKDHSYENNA
jgi:serine/threonine protein kinase